MCLGRHLRRQNRDKSQKKSQVYEWVGQDQAQSCNSPCLPRDGRFWWPSCVPLFQVGLPSEDVKSGMRPVTDFRGQSDDSLPGVYGKLRQRHAGLCPPVGRTEAEFRSLS